MTSYLIFGTVLINGHQCGHGYGIENVSNEFGREWVIHARRSPSNLLIFQRKEKKEKNKQTKMVV